MQAFCQRAVQEDRLSVLWIEGEIGIGKTMLAEQEASQLRHSGAIVISVRCYQETLLSMANLIADAIRVNPGFDSFLQEPIAPTVSSVASTLARFSSLRPTILIVEDIHCLPTEATAELSQFTRMLSDVPIGIMCTALPGECPARTALLPWISDTLWLPPFNFQEIESWLQAINPVLANNPQFVTDLHHATQGLPLLLESTFLSLRKQGASDHNTLITRVQEQTALSAEEIVLRFIQEMTDKERHGTEQLAVLGEVFSQEAADSLLGENTGILNSLEHKGILTQTTANPPPFIGKQSNRPLWQFSHTLIYNYFLKRSTVTPTVVAELIKDGAVLYSATPFVHVASAHFNTAAQATDIFQLLYRIVVATPITEHWLASQQLCRLLLGFYHNHRQELDPSEVSLRLNLQQLYVTSLKQAFPFAETTAHAVDEYLQLTQTPTTLLEAEHRLRALQFFTVHRSQIPQQVATNLNEFEALTKLFPELIQSPASIEFLIWLAKGTRITPAPQQVQRLQSLFHRTQKIADFKAHPHQQIALAIAMLRLYTEPEHKHEKTQLTKHIHHQIIAKQPPSAVWSAFILFLFECGEIRSGWNTLLCFYEQQAKYERQSEIDMELHKLYVACVFGTHLNHIEEELFGLVEHVSGKQIALEEFPGTTYIHIAACMYSIAIGQVFDNVAWTESTIAHIGGQDPYVSEVLQLVFISEQPKEIIRSLLQQGAVPERIRIFAEASIAEVNTLQEEELIVRAQSVFEQDIVDRATLYTLRTVLKFLERIQHPKDPSKSLADNCQKPIASALHKCLQWCYQKELLGFMEPLLAKSTQYLSRTELDEWMIRMQELRSGLAAEPLPTRKNTDTRLALTMTGTIGIRQSHFSHRRIQGGRSRQMLGLMVINELMGYRLSLDEFREVAVGIEGNPHEAANTTRVAISRLRTILGKEAIIADGKSAPRLNLDYLRVDLLDAIALLKSVRNAILERKPRDAFQSAIAALNTIVPEPAYPGLYGDFFDAARLDFEQLMRTSLLSVATLLKEENDLENRVEILERGLLFMPDDEEILATLVEALVSIGQNTEALNVRRRFERRSG